MTALPLTDEELAPILARQENGPSNHDRMSLATYAGNVRVDVRRLLGTVDFLKKQNAAIDELHADTVDRANMFANQVLELKTDNDAKRFHIKNQDLAIANLRAALEYACSVLAYKPFQDEIRARARGEKT